MSAPPSPTLSDSELLESLEETFDLASHRERRLEELNKEVRSVRVLVESDYGRMLTFDDEKKLVERMSKEKFCILHFFHPKFPRCSIMDQHLNELAPKYPHTLFLRTSVADTPFLITKFGVQVLPCVMVFVDGGCVDRLIGFEELGQTDNFTNKALEFRLKQSGVFPSSITLSNVLSPTLLNSVKQKGRDDDESEDEDRRWTGAPRKGKTGIRNGFASFGGDE